MSDFSDTIAAEMPELRALAESRMDSLCRVKYRTGESAIVNGHEQFVYADRATNVPCRVHPPESNGHETEPAAGMGVKVRRVWSIPMDAVEPKPGDFVELTTVGPLTDAAMAGKLFRILDVGQASQATARRMRVEEDA